MLEVSIDFLVKYGQGISIVLIAISTILLRIGLTKESDINAAKLALYEERLRKIDQKIIDCEQGIMLAHKFLSAVRQRSMDHAIKEATENPEKYLTGEFATTTFNPKEGKDET